MSRSGYSEDCEGWALICYRGAVASSIRGRRGQAFLKELLIAMESMKEKRLIEDELEADGEFCALGVVGKHRHLDLSKINPEDPDQLSKEFDIAPALAREIMWLNDEFCVNQETPESRWHRMRKWAQRQLNNRG